MSVLNLGNKGGSDMFKIAVVVVSKLCLTRVNLVRKKKRH